jgi:5-methylcytosine-specific restriction endonuclease McrA
MICSIEDCGKKMLALGWCAMHYSRMRRHGDIEYGRPMPYTEDERYAARKKSMAKWYEANKDSRRAVSRQYQQEHPDKTRERQHVRRARKRQVGSQVFSDTEMLDMYGTDCHICGQPVDLTAPRQVGKPGWERGLHREHVVPLAKGGDNTLANCRPSHGLCNLRKAS